MLMSPPPPPPPPCYAFNGSLSFFNRLIAVTCIYTVFVYPLPHPYKSWQTQLSTLENLLSEEGPFMAGSEVSLADATAWPSVLFFRYMMPKFDKEGFMGPRLTAWCAHMEAHPTGKRRVVGGLNEDLGPAPTQWL